MSYIRCLSNPEGLYVWGDCDNIINLAINFGDDQNLYQIPKEIFITLMTKFYNCAIDHEYKGAKVEEIKEKDIPIKELFSENYMTDDTEYKWKLSYKDWSIILWKVTLFYMASNAIEDNYEDKRDN